jgi:ADP-ribose pyrophosphatase YjhB (NUDIX family)
MTNPEIQLIANVVLQQADGRVLLTKYDDTEQWWLPGGELEPYEHPDEAAAKVVAEFQLSSSLKMIRVQSFRGRRGWHVAFDYLARCHESQAGDWFFSDELPQTKHGAWEAEVIAAVLAGS